MTTNGFHQRLQTERLRQAPPVAPAGDLATGDIWATSILTDSPMRRARDQLDADQQRRTADRFDGFSCIVGIDRGRIQFTKPLQHLGWDPTQLLDAWIEDGRMFIAPAHPTFGCYRGAAVTCRRNKESWRLPVFAQMRTALGLDEGDSVLVVADPARDLAFIDDIRRVVHHIYTEYDNAPTTS